MLKIITNCLFTKRGIILHYLEEKIMLSENQKLRSLTIEIKGNVSNMLFKICCIIFITNTIEIFKDYGLPLKAEDFSLTSL